MKQQQPLIQFHYLVPPFNFPNRTFLKSFIAQLFKKEGHPLQSLNYVFCSDDYLYKYNKTYLNHDTLTDIITFSLAQPSEPIIGDIYISIDRVRDNANNLNQPFLSELHRVIFHGALHLCGYKDKNKAQRQEMRAKEDLYLNKYFVPRETTSKKKK
jgi:probable rRNA maturation factor